MAEVILETRKLSKRYGLAYALEDCSFQVERGQIYGLVGRNGAGKTTLMRLICGHSRPTSGVLTLFGSGDGKSLTENRRRLGCMVAATAFYPECSARDNLKIFCMKRGLPENGRIAETLELVGLSGTDGKPFSKFSVGMKQRLGLAAALVTEPELLVLDEPMNGVDPVGIAEMRELFLRLNREKNVTILISSHILKELQAIATCYGFLEQGKFLKRLGAAELAEQCSDAISFRVSDTEKASIVLEQICGCTRYKVLQDGEILCYDNAEHPEQLNRELLENGVEVYQMMHKAGDLEKFFLELVKEGVGNA